jgi:aspartate/methionine/tyrosine aminotransferase
VWTDLESAWTDPVRGVLLASPANPTGTMIPRASLLEICARLPTDAFLIIDEIYQGLVGSQPQYRTALEVSSRPIILQSFSKYFGMTGWRLGWVVIPEQLVDGVRRLAQNLYICPPTISQYAALAAFSSEAIAEHERRRWIFRERIQRLAEGLKAVGMDVPVMPDGAFYLYADVSSTGLPASEFSRRLLEEFHIAATPGLDFGEYQNERFIRFACTIDAGVIDEVLRRVGAAVKRFRSS